MPRKKRRDAIENRERLIEAAFEVLSDRDPDLTVRELALKCNLGIGTAYRHFPTHDDLVRTLYDRAFANLAEVFVSRPVSASPWENLVALTEKVTFAIADFPAMRAVMRRMYDIDPTYAPGGETTTMLQGLVDAAVAEGQMRPGVTGGDLAMAAFAVAGVVGNPTPHERGMMRRHLAIYMDGLRAANARTELPQMTMNAPQFHAFLHRSNGPERSADA